MRPSFSAYLDLLRVLSALVVFLGHANAHLGLHSSVGGYAHQAVIVFFVISGYVIAYTRWERESEPTLFAARRLSRLLSVAIPAMVLTIVLDFTGRSLDPSLYVDAPFDYVPVRFFAPLTFTNEIGMVSIMPFSNMPFWSLCYEFWYYVLFGVVCFVPGKARVVSVIAILFLIGPKILLLFPIWLIGVLLYRSRIREQAPATLGWALFIASFVLLFALYQSPLPATLDHVTRHYLSDVLTRNLVGSKYFLTDYLCGPVIAVNFLGAAIIARGFRKVPRAISVGVRWGSSFTLSLYLFHAPLMLFFGTIIPGGATSAFWPLAVILACLATVVGLGYVTERNRKTFELRIVVPAVNLVMRTAKMARGAMPGSAAGVS